MMRIDLEHWPSMELQEPRHHASRLSGTRKLATYFIAALILFTMAVWFSVISLIAVFHWLLLAGPLDVVLVALCFPLEGKSSNYPTVPLAAFAGEGAK